ncbi:MAG: DUF3137 domain-containing protein [Planctomycetes bacterium]|nr:DUF3137 domain-containing protein [Planctomycetota bacterium]
MQPVVIAFVIVAVGALFYLSYQYHKKRRQAFTVWATKNGFSYDSNRSRELGRRFMFLNDLNKGSNRYACDSLSGNYQGYDVDAFTYHYETYSTDSKGNRRTNHHYLGVIAIKIENTFPEMRLTPEGFFSKIGQFIGFEDIDFESVEFSKKFAVHSKDKKLAYDFCNTSMMEYLLQHPNTSLELDQDTLALYDSYRLEPKELDGYLQRLVEIRSLMPDYLFRKQ